MPAGHAPPPPRPARAAAGAHYLLDGDASTIRVYAYRGGALAALGHNHALLVRGVEGELTLPADPAALAGHIDFAPGTFLVDDPAERAAGGADFPGVIDAADIDGTRRNLLGRDVLDVEHWPRITIELDGASGGPDTYTVQAALTVRGVHSAALVPVHVLREGSSLIADGQTSLSQRDLGLTPFSVMLGALKVEDSLKVRFHLVARRG